MLKYFRDKKIRKLRNELREANETIAYLSDTLAATQEDHSHVIEVANTHMKRLAALAEEARAESIMYEELAQEAHVNTIMCMEVGEQLRQNCQQLEAALHYMRGTD